MTDISQFTRYLGKTVQAEENIKAWEAKMKASFFFIEGEGWFHPDDILTAIRYRSSQGQNTLIRCNKDVFGEE